MQITDKDTNELVPTYENGFEAGEMAFADGLAYAPSLDSKFDKLLHHDLKDFTRWAKGWCDGWTCANVRAPWWDGEQWIKWHD